MRWTDLLYVIRQNLWRMKLRVGMTAIGVLIGTSAIILLVALGAGLQDIATQDLGSIGDLTLITVYSPSRFGGALPGMPAGRQAVLNEDALQRFRALPGVSVAAPVIQLESSAHMEYRRLVHGYAEVVGIDPRDADLLGLEVQSGTLSLGSGQAVVGAKIAADLYDPRRGVPPDTTPSLTGESITLVVQAASADGQPKERRVRLRVSGTFKATGDETDYSIYLTRREVERLNTWGSGRPPNYKRDGYPLVLVKVSDPRYALPVQNAISQAGFMAYSAQSILEGLNRFFLVIKVILGGVGGVALLVAGFGIANAMVMAIYERTREIGLMKAVGARNRDVLFIFLGEAGAIGALGGAGGVLFSMAAGALINAIGGSYLAAQAAQSGAAEFTIPTLVRISPFLAVSAVLFAAGVGLAAGIYPALRATRLSPIRALRYE